MLTLYVKLYILLKCGSVIDLEEKRFLQKICIYIRIRLYYNEIINRIINIITLSFTINEEIGFNT